MQRQAQFLTQVHTLLQVIVTDERSWWAQGQKIIQVVKKEVNTVIVNQNPLDKICNGCKNKWR